MWIYRTHDNQQIAVDGCHSRAMDEHTWRAYSHDEWHSAEVATDCFRGGVRTTMMLSRFLMERIAGRELQATEIVRRKKQKIGTLWDFRDKNLELVNEGMEISL